MGLQLNYQFERWVRRRILDNLWIQYTLYHLSSTIHEDFFVHPIPIEYVMQPCNHKKSNPQEMDIKVRKLDATTT
jgi:hypothetical protein